MLHGRRSCTEEINVVPGTKYYNGFENESPKYHFWGIAETSSSCLFLSELILKHYHHEKNYLSHLVAILFFNNFH